MKKKLFIGLMPLTMLALVGCKANPTVSDLAASCNKTFTVGDVINKSDIKVTATYSDKTTKDVTDWTCDVFKDDKYTFVDGDVGEKKFTVTYLTKTADVTVTVNKALTEKEKFLKVYKTYSDTFQNSKKIYNAKDISIKKGEAEAEVATEISYEDKSEQYPRHCVINDSVNIAGGDYEYNKFKDELDEFEESGATFEYLKGDNVAGINVINQGMVLLRYQFNSNGYLTEYTAMGESALEITTYTYSKDPHEKTDKEKWIEKADELNKTFLESKLEYSSDQLTYKFNNKNYSFSNFEYGKDESDDRTLSITIQGVQTPTVIASSSYSGRELEKIGTLDEKGTYTINNDGIIYKYDDAPDGYYKELRINKYGYPTYYSSSVSGTNNTYEYIYNGDPKSHEVTKAEWIKKANELNAAFLNSTLEYSSNQLTCKYDGAEKTFTEFAYGVDSSKNRELSIRVNDVTEVIASTYYSGDSLNNYGLLNNNGVYEIYDKEIVYTYPAASTTNFECKELRINSYGYLTLRVTARPWGNKTEEFIYNGDPKETVSEITLTASGNNYVYSSEPPAKGTNFKATVNYNGSLFYDRFACFYQYIPEATKQLTLGINDTNKQINVTSVTDNSGKALSCSVADNDLKFPNTMTSNVIVIFTLNEELTSTFYVYSWKPK